MWDMIIDAISNLIGGAGQAASSAGSALGQAAETGLGWLGQNAGSVLGAGVGAAGALAPLLMQGQSSAYPPSLLAPQAGTPQADKVAAGRSQMAQLQSQGLSGASPDFLANQLGLTPEELDRLMGGRQGGV